MNEPEELLLKPTALEDKDSTIKSKQSSQRKCIKISNQFIACLALGLLLLSCFFVLFGYQLVKKHEQAQLTKFTFQFMQLQQQITKLQNQTQQLQKNIIQLNGIAQNAVANRQLIKLSNAKQLIQLADYNLIYSYNFNSSLTALELADKQLLNLPSSIALNRVRQLISQNIQQLQTYLTTFNLNKYLTRLTSLQDKVLQLPSIATLQTKQLKANQTNWFNHLIKKLNVFSHLIVIRHFDRSIQPLLSAEQQIYLQKKLENNLEQAKWALLHQQFEIYHAQLQQAHKLIQVHFASNSPVTQFFLQEIKQLDQVSSPSVIPNLTITLQSINQLLINDSTALYKMQELSL